MGKWDVGGVEENEKEEDCGKRAVWQRARNPASVVRLSSLGFPGWTPDHGSSWPKFKSKPSDRQIRRRRRRPHNSSLRLAEAKALTRHDTTQTQSLSERSDQTRCDVAPKGEAQAACEVYAIISTRSENYAPHICASRPRLSL